MIGDLKGGTATKMSGCGSNGATLFFGACSLSRICLFWLLSLDVKTKEEDREGGTNMCIYLLYMYLVLF